LLVVVDDEALVPNRDTAVRAHVGLDEPVGEGKKVLAKRIRSPVPRIGSGPPVIELELVLEPEKMTDQITR
jgi:hypothetical protein